MTKVSISIIGLSGLLGPPVLEAINSGLFDNKIKFPVKALSRKHQTSTEKVEYIQTELTNDVIPFIVESLTGVDVIIELVTPIPTLLNTLEQIVEKVAPKIYIPSQFGVDIGQVATYSPGFLSNKSKHANAIKNPNVKTIDVVTSLFAHEGSFLYEYVGLVGINTEDKTIVQRGSPSTKFSITKVRDIGFSLVSIATLPVETIPTPFRISSDIITYQDVIDRYEASHNVKLSTVKTLTKEETLQELNSNFTKDFNFTDSDFTMDKFVLYVNDIIAQGFNKGADFTNIHNELINPKESLWKWSKY
ncbi:hypothetical protein DFJ63DRAFT_312817 [Scheffersomyces coipomensis]|uniref:uncharacterized protein n=1 Tax=Scheffersomyces coipomensis TaxID=1788519 RepID=UPI00315D065B